MIPPFKRPIVFAVDEAYIPALRTAVASVLMSTATPARPVEVIVLHAGVPKPARIRLANPAIRLEWREVTIPPELRLPVSDWVSAAAYYRLAIATTLSEFDSCLYLDADVLVLSTLAPLLLGICKQPISAVQDPQNPTLRAGDALP